MFVSIKALGDNMQKKSAKKSSTKKESTKKESK